MLLRCRIACSYPLHPAGHYGYLAVLKHKHGIPAERPCLLLPVWQAYGPGEWFWCSRCKAQNARRTRYAQALLTQARQAHHKLWQAKRRLPLVLGGRFISKVTQDRYARKHCPEGLYWCARGAHYVPRSDKSNREPCWTCYRLTFIKRATERVRRMKREDTQLRAAHDRLERQRGALRREIHQLRQLKRMIETEMLKRPEPPPTADLLQALLQPEEAPIRPLPAHRPRDRRKSFST